MSDPITTIRQLLDQIYGPDTGALAAARILPLLAAPPKSRAGGRPRFSERDVVLITYADTLRSAAGTAPLNVLHEFAQRHLKEVFSHIHILPFFPFSSDDGFSVMDFHAVNPEVGTWKDIQAIGMDFSLMFDYVLNHVSARSRWFQQYLAGEPGFADLAIAVAPETDLSAVVRPRALPLLTPVETADGRTVHVWTTFSADQIDLNWESVDVLERMIRVLLDYVHRGAAIVRMDAVAYLWKAVGTSCIHLSNTHRLVRLFRAVLDAVAPQVAIITETNVPHQENVAYFGNGSNEAQMVYNFTLPPLLLHAFVTGRSAEFNQWAAGLPPASDGTAFFNFTASHDGIGVRPLEGILPQTAVDALVTHISARGGRVTVKANADGPPSPYELNVTYVDALGGIDDPALHARRFLSAQAVMLALPGVPAVYIHSLLGSRNWQAGVAATGQHRAINREPLIMDPLAAELADPGQFRSLIFGPYCRLIQKRREQPAFSPSADAAVLDMHPNVIALRRRTQSQILLALTNLSAGELCLPLADAGDEYTWLDLFTGETLCKKTVRLPAYGFRWIQASPSPE